MTLGVVSRCVLTPRWVRLLFVFRCSCLFTRVRRRNTLRRFWTSWTRRENCFGMSRSDLLPLVFHKLIAWPQRRALCQVNGLGECQPAAGSVQDAVAQENNILWTWGAFHTHSCLTDKSKCCFFFFLNVYYFSLVDIACTRKIVPVFSATTSKISASSGGISPRP